MPPDLIVALHDIIRLFEQRSHCYVDIGNLADPVFHRSNESDLARITLAVASSEYSEVCDALKLPDYNVPDEASLPLGTSVTWPIVEIELAFSGRLSRKVIVRPNDPFRCGDGIKDHATLWFVRTEDFMLLQLLANHGVLRETIQELGHDACRLVYNKHWAEKLGVLSNLEAALTNFDRSSDTQ